MAILSEGVGYGVVLGYVCTLQNKYKHKLTINLILDLVPYSL